MKIKNSKTGEIIDLSAPKVAPKTKEQQTEARIKERGTIQSTVKEAITNPSIIKKITSAAEVVGSPLASIESGVANPSLELQKGNTNIGDLIKQAALGLSLQRQGQYGDVMKNAGYNPILSDTAGLVLSLSPVKIYSEVLKTFGAISKMSDKGMLKAGDNLLNAVNQAKTAVGTKVAQEFAKATNVPVDGIKFTEAVSKLPDAVAKKATTVFGDLGDFANGLTVGKLREFKQFVGKLRPNSFGQAERGIQENIDVDDLNKAYHGLKVTMEDALRTPQTGIPAKAVDYLMGLEESFSKVADAGRYIRKQVVDPVLKVATRVGEFSKKVGSESDVAPRMALNTIKQTSREAMNYINKSMKEIESFNRWQSTKQVAKHVANAVFFGGVAGGIGGKILRNAQKSSQT